MPRAATVVGPEEELAEALMTAVDLDPNFAPHYVHLFRYLAGVGDWRFFEYMEMYRGVVEERLVTRYQAQWDFLHGEGEGRAAGEAYYTESWSANFFGEILFRSDSTVERSIELLHLNPSVPAGAEGTFVRPTLAQFDGLRDAADTPGRSLDLFLPAVLTNETIGEVSAEALARTGRPERAIRCYESNMTSFRVLKRLRLGELHEDVGDREAATENYRGFLRISKRTQNSRCLSSVREPDSRASAGDLPVPATSAPHPRIG